MPLSKLVPDDPALGFVPEAQQQFLQEQMDLVDPTLWLFPNAAFPIHEEPEPVFTPAPYDTGESASVPVVPTVQSGYVGPLGGPQVHLDYDHPYGPAEVIPYSPDDGGRGAAGGPGAAEGELFGSADGFGGFPSDGFGDEFPSPGGYSVEAPRPISPWPVPASPPRAVIMGDDGRLVEVYAPLSPARAQPPPTNVSPYERVPVTSSFSIKDCGCGCGQCGK